MAGPRVVTDSSCDLPDELLVDPNNGQPGGVLELEADARGRLDLDRVAVAKAELELLADFLGAIADAGDFEALAIASRDAGDHVRHEGPGEAVQLAMVLGIARSRNDDRAVLALHAHLGRQGALELAPRAGHGDPRTLDRHLDAAGNRDGQTSDSGHALYQT